MVKVSFSIIALFIISSCTNPDCESVKEAFYPEEYYLIVREVNINQTWLKATGYSAVTNSRDNIMVHNNWIIEPNEVEAGDTIKKERGKLLLSIHKKDTVINFEWFCKGTVYR
jgi:hypothetical protein